MSSFNKKGDGGTTSLLFGHRVPKHSPRPEAYGVLDEANSALGLARALVSDADLKNNISGIQEDIFLMGAELASLPDEISKLKSRISEEHTHRLEVLLEKYESSAEMPSAFISPGGTAGAAALDLARSIIRRAERRIAKLFDEGEVINPELLRYCNRLADLLFTLARYEESTESETDPKPGRNS
jgi:cob(I)alamin adenosyltransferase